MAWLGQRAHGQAMWPVDRITGYQEGRRQNGSHVYQGLRVKTVHSLLIHPCIVRMNFPPCFINHATEKQES